MEGLLAYTIDIYAIIIIPLLIFLARLVDVSMGTIRVIFVSRRLKYLAPLVGFFEILVWLMAIGQVMKNLSSPACYIAYAGGFSLGNYLGIAIAEKLSLGVVMVRVITEKDATGLVDDLKANDYRVTSMDGHGAIGKVKLVFTIVPRRRLKKVVQHIKKFNPKAFYTIEEVDFVEKGTFQQKRNFNISRFYPTFKKRKAIPA